MTPPLSWEDFRRTAPRFSIALDGYVSGGPRFDPGLVVANFNHHEEVDRLATRATCGQVLMTIRMGLFDTFRDGDGPRAEVYVNDCDEDVCMSHFLLEHHFMVHGVINPGINRLVNMVDMLDVTAGAYPFPLNYPIIQMMAWVFEPYRVLRSSGEIDRKDADAYRRVIGEVGERIAAHAVGEGERIPLDSRYERIGGGNGWAMIREIGEYGRTGAYYDGAKAFVTVRDRGDGRYVYAIGRMSPFIRFDIARIFDSLNEAEGIVGSDRWGGGDTIGGSPRVSGSALPPTEVERIVNRCCEAAV
jgi:hypothetical protein